MARKNFIFKYGIDIAPNSNGIGTVFTVNNRTGNIGFGTTNPTSKIHVVGTIIADNFTGNSSYALQAGIATNVSGGTASVTSLNVTGLSTLGIVTAGNIFSTGIITATSFSGNSSSATQLQNSRNFSISGDFITAPSISFNGTGNVALAATITPDSIILGTYTSGDYVKNISGTANQITVTGGTGESSIPTISLPPQLNVPQDLVVLRDIQVNRNLNVNGNITIGGTSATLFTTEFKVGDPDIILGFRTDSNGNDISTDNTADHGGIAIASTEGSPLVSLYNVAIGETNPATYKKIMWFKNNSFAGLGTDAWLMNYAVGIGSTQFPTGTRLAAGSVQFTERDLAVVRNINSSGIITGTLANTLTLNTSGTGLSGSTTYNNSGAATFTVTSNATSANTASTIVARDASGNFSAAGGTFAGQIISTRANSTSTGEGQIYLNGATGNRIDFNTNGVAAPTFTTRSVGTKLVLYPELGASAADYALGIEGSTLWFGVPSTSQQFKWYAGTTNIATLSGGGAFNLRGSIGISEVGASGTRLLLSSTPSGAVINQNDNSNIFFQTQGVTRLTILDGTGNLTIAGTTVTAGGNTVWHAGNDGSGSGLDADLLDSYHLSSIIPFHSGSDFVDGTLVITDIDASVAFGNSFVIEVTGKSYTTSGPPFSFIAQGYLYNSTIINTSGVNLSGYGITYIKAMNYGGTLSFWWPRISYWNSFNVVVRNADGSPYNRVTAIINAADPAGATKKVQINLITTWNSANDGSGSGLDADLLDGLNASSANTGSTIVARDASGNFSAGTITANLTNTVTGTNSTEIVRGNMADNDQFRILIGGTTSNSGFVEFATADDGTEPIYFRQYTGVFSSIARTLTLLDANGDSSFPGTLTATVLSSPSGKFTGNLAAWNSTTPGRGVGGVHLGAASGSSNVGPAITFGARDSDAGTTGQAGIYINSDGSYGTRMHFATTDSYAIGSKVAMTINESGVVNFTRATPTSGGNTIWHAGNDGSGSGLDADLWDGYQLSTRTTWNTNSALNIVVGQLAWKNYGNNHTIFDASAGTSPDGTSVNNTNSQVAWTGTYPTLMGWNGANTYGVRVDSARISDSTSGSSASCTGNAATATSSPLLSALGNYVWSASTLPTSYSMGIQCSFVQASNGWQNYGSVMNMMTYSGGGGSLQLFVPYSPTYGGTGLQVRFGNYDVSSGNSWTAWKTLWDSGNDGAGSGLDADLLDGFNSDRFLRSSGFPGYGNWNDFGNAQQTVYEVYQENFNIGSNTGSTNFPTNRAYAYGALINFGANSSARGQIYISHAGNDLVFRGGWGTASWQTWNRVWTDIIDGAGSGLDADLLDGLNSSQFLRSDVSTTNSVDIRAPIFYDSNDTSFYLDPASTGLALATNGIVSSGTGTNGGFQNRTFTGGRNRIWSFGNADAYGISYFQGGPDYIGLHFGTATQAASQFWVSDSGISQTSGSSRAPVFYDSNNTGYYVDPNSTSNLALVQTFELRALGQVRATGWYGSNSSSHTGPAIEIGVSPPNSSDGYILAYNRNNGTYLNMNFYATSFYFSGQSGGFLTCDTSVRSPIFYDSNDTGYYIDPAGTSQLSAVQANNWFRSQNETGLYSQSYGQHFYPDAGGFYWESDGPIRIRAGYEGGIQGYVGYHDSDGFGLLHSGGSWWLNTQNNDAHLTIGGSQANNAYNSVTGRRLMFGGGDADAQGNYYIGTNLENYGGNYNKLDIRWHTGIRMGAQPNYGGIRFYDTEDLGTQVFAIGKDGSYAQANQSMRAPIFYDLDDTGYYLNPNSTSEEALRIRGGALHGPNVTWGAYLLVGGNGRQSYIDNGSVASVCATNGNLHIDAASGYNTYINHYDGNIIYFGGGSNNNWGEFSGGIFYSYADTRSPIFYDYNNTAYYCDPASTSRMGYIRPNSISIVGSQDNGTPRWDFKAYVVESQHHYGQTSTQTMYFGEANPINVPGDLRVPILYDYNNTSYYVDGNNESRLYRVRVGPYAGSTSSGNQTGLELINTGGTGDGDVAAISFHCAGYWGLHMHLRHDSYFGIGGWSASTWRWYVQTSTGDMTAAGNVTAYSDIRLKEEIAPLENSLDKLMTLNGVSFRWKNLPDIVGHPGKKDFGIIAQEVEKVFPEVIHESAHESPDGDKYKTVAYDKLVPVLIEAIKEQQRDINNLKQQIKELKTL